MKKYLLFVLSLLFLITPTAQAQKTPIPVGKYLLENTTSIVAGFEVTENEFHILLNPPTNDKNQDPFTSLVLNWQNLYTNEHTLLNDDGSAEAPKTKLAINFWMSEQYPTFKLSLIQPEYVVKDNTVLVKYNHEVLLELQLNEAGNLTDTKGHEFTLTSSTP